MTNTVPVSHSLLSAEALARQISVDYALAGPVTAALVSPGVNDTYQVMSGQQSSYYRVYRAGLRSRQDVQFEVDLLLHLQAEGVQVSVPIAKRDGSHITEIAAPEGLRYGVLFTSAPGKVLEYVEEDAFQYGRAVARLHTAMDTFQPATARFHLDLDHLLEQPLRTIEPYAKELGLWQFYADLGDRLRRHVSAVADQLEQGICHGDLHGHNVHKAEDGALTLFDFDCGGPGWRAYDLSVYRWAVGRHAKNLDPWDAFLKGYSTLREVRQPDLQIIPVFVGIRNFWLLGLHANQVNQRGTASVRMWVEGAAKVLQNLELSR